MQAYNDMLNILHIKIDNVDIHTNIYMPPIYIYIYIYIYTCMSIFAWCKEDRERQKKEEKKRGGAN